MYALTWLNPNSCRFSNERIRLYDRWTDRAWRVYHVFFCDSQKYRSDEKHFKERWRIFCLLWKYECDRRHGDVLNLKFAKSTGKSSSTIVFWTLPRDGLWRTLTFCRRTHLDSANYRIKTIDMSTTKIPGPNLGV